MKKILLVIVIAAFAWHWYSRQHPAGDMANRPATTTPRVVDTIPTIKQLAASNDHQFSCDGRLHCSQMTSCEEATWFLKNCPGVKMDGDHDGIPCEQQHCR